MSQLESFWLQGGTMPFIGGAVVSAPDILLACELEQLAMLNKVSLGTV